MKHLKKKSYIIWFWLYQNSQAPVPQLTELGTSVWFPSLLKCSSFNKGYKQSVNCKHIPPLQQQHASGYCSNLTFKYQVCFENFSKILQGAGESDNFPQYVANKQTSLVWTSQRKRKDIKKAQSSTPYLFQLAPWLAGLSFRGRDKLLNWTSPREECHNSTRHFLNCISLRDKKQNKQGNCIGSEWYLMKGTYTILSTWPNREWSKFVNYWLLKYRGSTV